MGNLGTKSSVQHHEHLKLFDVVDEDFTESIWHHVSCSLGIPVADLGHLDLALEAPSDTIVDTMGLPPVRLLG